MFYSWDVGLVYEIYICLYILDVCILTSVCFVSALKYVYSLDLIMWVLYWIVTDIIV